MPNPRADNVRIHLAKLHYFGKADGMPSVQVHRIAYAADKLWMATPAVTKLLLHSPVLLAVTVSCDRVPIRSI